MSRVNIPRLLAQAYDAHAREHAPDNRCGCDLCEWVEATPGVLQAIAEVDTDLAWDERKALHGVLATACGFVGSPEHERARWLELLRERIAVALPFTVSTPSGGTS